MWLRCPARMQRCSAASGSAGAAGRLESRKMSRNCIHTSRHSVMRVKDMKLDRQNLRRAFLPPRSWSGTAFQIFSSVMKSESGEANALCAALAISFLSSGRSRGSGMLSPAARMSMSSRQPSSRACSSIRPSVGSSGNEASSRPRSVISWVSLSAPSSCSRS